MTKRIAVFQEELGSGVTPSMPKLRVPFFIDGRNIRFGAQGAEVTSPWFRLIDKLQKDPVRGMIALNIGGQKIAFWGTHRHLFKWNGEAKEAEEVGADFKGQKTGTPTVPASVWTFANQGLVTVGTNGTDAPQKSLGGNPFIAYTGLEERYGTVGMLRAFGSRFVAFDLETLGPDVVAWSDETDLDQWVPGVGNSSGQLPITDANGAIVAAESLGPSGILFYTQGSIHNLFFAGSVFIIGQKKVIDGMGAASRQAVVPVGQQHYVFDAAGIYVTDGRTFKFIDEPVIRKHIYGQLNFDQISHVFGWHNRSYSEIQWFYPTKNLGMEGVGYNYGNGSWTLYPYELTSALGIGVFTFPIACNSFGSIFDLDPNFPGGGVDLTGTHLQLNPEARLLTGYGTFGYGQVGYGGRLIPDG